jgi:hypothetical protein
VTYDELANLAKQRAVIVTNAMLLPYIHPHLNDVPGSILSSESQTNNAALLRYPFRVHRPSVPLRVAAVCFRRTGERVEFLLFNLDGGLWGFPTCEPDIRRSHSEAAERRAWAVGVQGHIQPRHFHLFLEPSDSSFEYVVKAFLMPADHVTPPKDAEETFVWAPVEESLRMLSRNREARYTQEMQAVINRAAEVLK